MLKLYAKTTIEVPLGDKAITLHMGPRTGEQEEQIRLARANNRYVSRMVDIFRSISSSHVTDDVRRAALDSYQAMTLDRETTRDMLDIATVYAEVLADQVIGWEGVVGENDEPMPWPAEREHRMQILRHEILFPDFVIGATGIYDIKRAERLGKSATVPAGT